MEFCGGAENDVVKEAMEETERRKEGGNGYQRGCGDGGQVGCKLK